MMTTTTPSLLFGLLALGLMTGATSAQAQAPTPIPVIGFSRDVIAESPLPTSSQGVTPGDLKEHWMTTGFDGNASHTGIPVGATAVSAFTNTVTGGHSTFTYQTATDNNALVANYNSVNGSVTGTLTLATPGKYSSLAFAAAGLNSGAAATSTGFVTYTDSSTLAFTFDASDWDINRVGGTDIFSPNIDRAVYASYNTPPNLVDDSHGHVNVYETDIATDPTKVIQSITFSGTYTASPFTAAAAGVDVFAVSGVAVAAPEPSVVAALSLGALGLVTLTLQARRRRGRAIGEKKWATGPAETRRRR